MLCLCTGNVLFCCMFIYLNYIALGELQNSVICMCERLYVCLVTSQKPCVKTSQNFLYMLFLPYNNGIRHVILVLWMIPCFHIRRHI